MCNAQAKHSVRSRAQTHLHAHVPNAAPLTAHEHLRIYDKFIITCETVKMTSFPTAISGVFHEPTSFRFNTSSHFYFTPAISLLALSADQGPCP